LGAGIAHDFQQLSGTTGPRDTPVVDANDACLGPVEEPRDVLRRERDKLITPL
jgi:hypothetical protein